MIFRALFDSVFVRECGVLAVRGNGGKQEKEKLDYSFEFVLYSI
jgi:hypothetical protein